MIQKQRRKGAQRHKGDRKKERGKVGGREGGRDWVIEKGISVSNEGAEEKEVETDLLYIGTSRKQIKNQKLNTI